MQMKSARAADPSGKGIAGAVRGHIISRLQKATGYAEQLLELVRDQSTSGANETDLLEAHAYAASLSGALWLEKRRWDECLRDYAVARVIYGILGQNSTNYASRELLSTTIDPSIRYAAYQLRLPRPKSLQSIAIEYFPSDAEIRSEVERADPDCLSDGVPGGRKTVDGGAVPDSVTWRSRTVGLEDASTALAIAASYTAENHLASWLAGPAGQVASAKDKAAAYDSVISASQDAVDATKSAIEDLANEGVDSGDKRMQALQVTRTAVHYTLVGWRVGRNRILCGDHDGISTQNEQHTFKSGEHNGKKLTRLREKVALYDSILQNVELILELPGIAADLEFVNELEGKRKYFRSLRYVSLCIIVVIRFNQENRETVFRSLAIGQSHSLLGGQKNALALYFLAFQLATSIGSTIDAEGPPNLDISRQQVQLLTSVAQGLVAEYRGIVTLETLSTKDTTKPSNQAPIVGRLQEYSGEELDPEHLVPYPPQVKPIPVKPLFLDVAWNYIDYPRDAGATQQISGEQQQTPEKKGGRRGWFSFGR